MEAQEKENTKKDLMKYLSFILLLTLMQHACAMHLSYCLPDEQTITKRLWDAGFSNFAKESRMGKELANKSMTPIILYSNIENILLQYMKKYPTIIQAWDPSSNQSYPTKYPKQSKLIRIILQDYPNAIAALERNQWIKSKEKIVGIYQFNPK